MSTERMGDDDRHRRVSDEEPAERGGDPLGGGAGDDRGEDEATPAGGVTGEGDDLARRLDVDPERGDVKG